MQWYEILITVIGTLGGVSGFISIYKAKSEKTGVDINNMQSMLDEAHKMYDEAREEKHSAMEEMKALKVEMAENRADFERRFDALEKRFNTMEERVRQMKGVIMRAHRCQKIDDVTECPVMEGYNNLKCTDCMD